VNRYHLDTLAKASQQSSKHLSGRPNRLGYGCLHASADIAALISHWCASTEVAKPAGGYRLIHVRPEEIDTLERRATLSNEGHAAGITRSKEVLPLGPGPREAYISRVSDSKYQAPPSPFSVAWHRQDQSLYEISPCDSGSVSQGPEPTLSASPAILQQQSKKRSGTSEYEPNDNQVRSIVDGNMSKASYPRKRRVSPRPRGGPSC